MLQEEMKTESTNEKRNKKQNQQTTRTKTQIITIHLILSKLLDSSCHFESNHIEKYLC